MNSHLTVIVSRGVSRNPAKRQLEEETAAALAADPSIRVMVVPHLNDVRSDGVAIRALREVQGDLVVLSWLYERAAHWILDRCGIEGRVGQAHWSPQQRDARQGGTPASDEPQRVIETRNLPDRKIYCLELRTQDAAPSYMKEVKRIAAATRGWPRSAVQPATANAPAADRIEESTKRRWYPVIDYSRCTNCMECVDFCLFGVYGIDETETILVEQPDYCRKGCPACSRVCPESAIIFPQHATPAIAGAPAGAGSLKVDLSKLFGAPDHDRSARELADSEREEQIRRSPGKSASKDELDKLIDSLDELDL
ncbi:MAG: ATP-binding protein [Pirellulaceae bacterium]